MPRKASPLRAELVPLGFVVKDLGRALESLSAEAVLRMEMGEGQNQRARPRQVFGDLKHLGAVRGPHAGIDDERRVVCQERFRYSAPSGTRLSPMTKTPLAISLSALGSTFGGGGVIVHGSIRVRGSRRRRAAGRRCVRPRTRSRRKADFAAPCNALGSIKNDDEHEKRQSAVAQSGRARRGASPPIEKPTSASRNSFCQQRYGERADNRAGQAARSADHQHRDDEEGQVEIVGLDPNRAEKMREQHAGDAAQEGAER